MVKGEFGKTKCQNIMEQKISKQVLKYCENDCSLPRCLEIVYKIPLKQKSFCLIAEENLEQACIR